MTNRKKKVRFTLAGSLPGMVCTRKQASHLLQGFRRNYQLLTPEERDQIKRFMLGLYRSDTGSHPGPDMGKSEVEH